MGSDGCRRALYVPPEALFEHTDTGGAEAWDRVIPSDLSEIDVDRLEHARLQVPDDDELLAAAYPAEHHVQQARGEGWAHIDDDDAVQGGALAAVPGHGIGLGMGGQVPE